MNPPKKPFLGIYAVVMSPREHGDYKIAGKNYVSNRTKCPIPYEERVFVEMTRGCISRAEARVKVDKRHPTRIAASALDGCIGSTMDIIYEVQ